MRLFPGRSHISKQYIKKQKQDLQEAATCHYRGVAPLYITSHAPLGSVSCNLIGNVIGDTDVGRSTVLSESAESLEAHARTERCQLWSTVAPNSRTRTHTHDATWRCRRGSPRSVSDVASQRPTHVPSHSFAKTGKGSGRAPAFLSFCLTRTERNLTEAAAKVAYVRPFAT